MTTTSLSATTRRARGSAPLSGWLVAGLAALLVSLTACGGSASPQDDPQPERVSWVQSEEDEADENERTGNDNERDENEADENERTGNERTGNEHTGDEDEADEDENETDEDE